MAKKAPVIYFNPALTGNQDVFDVKVQDYMNADTLPFGRGFQDLHQISFLMSLRTMSTFQVELLKDGQYAHVVIDKEHFLSLITEYTSGIVDSEKFFDAFVLTKENISSQLQKGDDIIWKMGVNKYRHEIRPFVCLENNMVAISYAALDQAKNLWLSYFANGGMVYSNHKDQLTEAIFDRNEELSKQLVSIISRLVLGLEGIVGDRLTLAGVGDGEVGGIELAGNDLVVLVVFTL